MWSREDTETCRTSGLQDESMKPALKDKHDGHGKAIRVLSNDKWEIYTNYV